MTAPSLLKSIEILLDGYSPLEPQQKERKEMFLSGASQSMLRKDYTEPGHFTISGFVRTFDCDAIALIFHPRFQKWIQPGGHFEETDVDVLQAAKRELKEETGLKILEYMVAHIC